MTNKRERIIETACQLMEMQGYHATGLNQILEESGAPKGSLYYYFPEGKEGLAVEAIEHTSRVIAARLRESLAAHDDPADALAGFLRATAYHVESSDFRAGGPITAIALEAASTNERLNAACRDAYLSWQEVIAGKLLEGGLEETRSQRLAALLMAIIEGAILLSRCQRDVAPLHDAATEVAALLACA